MKKLNTLQLIKEQIEKEKRRKQAALVQLATSK
jgi:hypothetical protein